LKCRLTEASPFIWRFGDCLIVVQSFNCFLRLMR